MTVYIKKLTFPPNPEVEQPAVEISNDAPPIKWDGQAQNSTHEDKFFAVNARLVSSGMYSPGETGS
jgi:hypothetical protein